MRQKSMFAEPVFEATASGVGRSRSRTPFKHWLLSAEIGRLCGIFTHNPRMVHAVANPFHVVDLCAGDGIGPTGRLATSSPKIILHHLGIAAASGVSVRATLIERNALSFDLLQKNIQPLPTFCEAICSDATQYRVRPVSRFQQTYILADPNTIADWPVTPEMLDSMSETTSMLVTLGCNVGGLKRLTQQQRLPWFDRMSEITNRLPRYHDAILVRLERDASQWAYLLRLPSKWTDNTISMIQLAGKRFLDFELDIASFRQSHQAFSEQQRILFFTKSENEAIHVQA